MPTDWHTLIESEWSRLRADLPDPPPYMPPIMLGTVADAIGPALEAGDVDGMIRGLETGMALRDAIEEARDAG